MLVKKPLLPHGAYFEGVLQLRNSTPELVQWVQTQTAKDKKSLITKELKIRGNAANIKGGVDLYFSNQHYLQALGKKMREKFFGEYKLSYTLHTRSHITSKDLYRITILFRQAFHKRGERVYIDNEEHEIIQIGRRIITRKIVSGKKQHWTVEEFEATQRVLSDSH